MVLDPVQQSQYWVEYMEMSSPVLLLAQIFCQMFLQMQKGLIAPIHNLENPIANDLKFARGAPVESATRNALVFSFGFGGINLATILHATKS